jgi:hypothetical protein
MQARLEIRRSPFALIVIVFVITAALVLGAAMGYALKGATLVGGPARIVVVQPTSDPGTDACLRINNHKAC